MTIGFPTVYPVGLGPSQVTIPGFSSSTIFPARFSPLAGSIDINERDPHVRIQLGDGYEFRQRDSIYAPEQSVSMSFIAAEGKGLEILVGFLLSVGYATAFSMNVPGCQGTRWFLSNHKRKHIGGYHWQVDISIETRRSL